MISMERVFSAMIDKDENYFVLFPESFHPLEKSLYLSFTREIRKKIKAFKKKRDSSLQPFTYITENGEELKIFLKPSVIQNFLLPSKFQNFISFLSGKTSPTSQIFNQVEERDIRDFFSKSDLFSRLRSLKNLLYSHDTEWKRFLKKENLSIAIILPAFNEENLERNIHKISVLKELGLVKEIIVADGYSDKYEPEKIREKNPELEFTIVKQNGIGKGSGIESAIKYALFQKHDFVITLDSDTLSPLSEVYRNPPLDFDIEFFGRSFIHSIILSIQKFGTKKTKSTFFKASYLRFSKDAPFTLRYGLVTLLAKDFFHRTIHSNHNLYPLSGEMGFNPEFLLNNLSFQKNLLSSLKISRISPPHLPAGFCLEAFINGMIDVLDHRIFYVNLYLHHHGPAEKPSKFKKGAQEGEVLTGALAGILASLFYLGEKNALEYFKKLPKDVVFGDRFTLEL